MMSSKMGNDGLQYTRLMALSAMLKQLPWPSTPELYYTLCPSMDPRTIYVNYLSWYLIVK